MKMKLTICLFIILGLVVLSFAQDVSVHIPEGMDTLELPVEKETPTVPDVTGISKVYVDGNGGINRSWFVTIAVCDPQKAFAGYEKANVLTAGLDKEIAQAKQVVQQVVQQIAAKQKELDAVKRKKGDEYEKLFEEVATMKAEYRAFVKVKTAELDGKKNVLLKSGLADVYTAIDEVAKAKGLNLVLSRIQGNETRGSVLFADESLDITDAVIEMLNRGGE